jgi:hypothetical protein
VRRGDRLRNLKESFKDIYLNELTIELNEDYPTHIPVGTTIEIVFKASKKAGKDSYLVLKHFQFTDKEIRDYFERLGKKN